MPHGIYLIMNTMTYIYENYLHIIQTMQLLCFAAHITGFQPINFTGCGTEKGCFRYSRGSSRCPGGKCEYAATYRAKGDQGHFELSGRGDWVALGFSSDDAMVCDHNAL